MFRDTISLGSDSKPLTPTVLSVVTNDYKFILC
jgi:hypothetical protein